jgi:hypothetical protein
MLLFLLTVGAILSIIGVALLAVCSIKYGYDAETLGKSLLIAGMLLVFIAGGVYIGVTYVNPMIGA